MPLFNFAGPSLMGSGLYIKPDIPPHTAFGRFSSPVRDLNLESVMIPLDSPAGVLLPVRVSTAFTDDRKWQRRWFVLCWWVAIHMPFTSRELWSKITFCFSVQRLTPLQSDVLSAIRFVGKGHAALPLMARSNSWFAHCVFARGKHGWLTNCKP